MNERLCLATIKTEYSNLTPKERLVADFILENCESVVAMSIGELAERAGVVKSVVIRTCKSLGFSGYSQLKIALAKENAKNLKFNYTPYINGDDNPEAVMQKIFSANIKTLHDTMNGLDKKVLTETVESLSRAKNIYIYGIGTSAGIAADFQYRLMQLGFTAFCFTDIVSIKVSTLNIKQGDIAIGISNSGRTSATVDALKVARENGAKTACVTSYPRSEITKHSDFPIVIYTDEIQYPIEAISARIAHISVLDSLCISLSAKNYDKAMQRSAKTHALIDTVRY